MRAGLRKLSVFLITLLLAISLVACACADISEAEVYSRLIAQKTNYPEGTHWNDASRTYVWQDIIGMEEYTHTTYTGYGCVAFAYEMSDAAFGKNTLGSIVEDYSFDQIRVGDILRINHDSHSVIVLEKQSDGVVVAEGGYNDSVHWGRKLKKAEVVEKGNFLITRYGTGNETVAPDPVPVSVPEPAPAAEPVPVDTAKVTSFVSRCYNLILGREADEGGLNNWVGQLASGSSNAATIISNFLGSQEYISQNRSNAETVDILYSTMLNRPADEAGKAHWAGFLDHGDVESVVINGFCGSQEFLGLCAEYGIEAGSVAPASSQAVTGLEGFVIRCYREALGRGSDEGGLAYWCSILQNRSQTPQQVAAGFVFSDEMNAREKIQNNPDALLDSLYQLYLGRPADADGKAYWKQRIADGLSLEGLNEGFALSAEFSGIIAGYGL